MTSWQTFAEQFGPWMGLLMYILVKDGVPFMTKKWLPSKIKAAEDERKEKHDEAEWRKRIEEERLFELKEIATSTRTLTLNMAQTNERIATMMANQQNIIRKQDTHHDAMMVAVGDMRQAVGERRGEEAARGAEGDG